MSILIAVTAGIAAGTAAGAAVAAWRARQAGRRLQLERSQFDLQMQALRAELAGERSRQEAELTARLTAEQARQAASAEKARAELEARLDRREAKLAEREGALAERDAKAAAREHGQLEREAKLDRRIEAFERREQALAGRDQAQARRDEEHAARVAALDARAQEADQRLAAIAGLTPDQAREQVLARVDAELADEQGRRLAKHEKDLAGRAKELGVEIISRAIQRYAAEHTADTAATKIQLKDEEMKGRIIGKEGRNIKSFEQATGVDLIIDETPGVITISCFSGLRREIARRTLLILLEDGRIHPGRIEEVMAKVQQDLDREVLKLGEDAAFATEVSGLHPQLLRLLGKLQWRTSYGQNVLKHTQEVAWLCAALAADLGLDPRLARRCGLLHDIGKAIDHDQEGSHPVLGYEALKRYGESEIVANAALAHHEGHAVLSAYTTLAAAADAISAARPGARSHDAGKYLKRLEQLEEIAASFPGVQKAYAIQAGRELRVIVNHHTLGDGQIAKIAHDIARRIEGEVAFPGEVKVTVIRELRQTAVAR
jgi:ribonuclease Y